MNYGQFKSTWSKQNPFVVDLVMLQFKQLYIKLLFWLSNSNIMKTSSTFLLKILNTIKIYNT